MAEYWYFADGFEERVRGHLSSSSEAEVDLDFTIPEKDFNAAGKGSSELKNLLNA